MAAVCAVPAVRCGVHARSASLGECPVGGGSPWPPSASTQRCLFIHRVVLRCGWIADWRRP